MAIFSDNAQNALDFVWLRDGGVSLYLRQDYIAEDIIWLKNAGYKVVQFACEDWSSEREMHESLFSALGFPAYYGMNLNALDEVITKINVPLNGGIVLVLLSYDRFANGPGGPIRESPYHPAEALLDILSRASHEFLLSGRRFLTLVQSSDPLLSFPKLGGRAPQH
jgi:RNAse (barnase) inhibitor barstar